TRKSISFLRPMYPCLLARMVNHVGSPWMFEGNMFFPETGMPIWKMERIKTLLAVWLPEPFTVATCMLKSLITGWWNSPERGEAGETSRVDIYLRNPFRRADALKVNTVFLFDYTPQSARTRVAAR